VAEDGSRLRAAVGPRRVGGLPPGRLPTARVLAGELDVIVPMDPAAAARAVGRKFLEVFARHSGDL
jgi:hypothetical protein